MIKLLLFCILLVVCWPLALVSVILYPLIWLVLLPFRIVGVAVEGVLDLIRTLFSLPLRLLGARYGNHHGILQPNAPASRTPRPKSRTWGTRVC